MTEYDRFILKVKKMEELKKVYDEKGCKFGDSYYMAFQHLNAWLNLIEKRMKEDITKNEQRRI